uniref:Uncharacterized protein n=1 Tax=Arundo donax TaxID=35708 RepID=A0A0A9EUH3_ARUDO
MLRSTPDILLHHLSRSLNENLCRIPSDKPPAKLSPPN